MNQELFKVTEQKIVLTIQVNDFFELQNLIKLVKNNGWTIENSPKYVTKQNIWELTISQPVNTPIKLFE